MYKIIGNGKVSIKNNSKNVECKSEKHHGMSYVVQLEILNKDSKKAQWHISGQDLSFKFYKELKYAMTLDIKERKSYVENNNEFKSIYAYGKLIS